MESIVKTPRFDSDYDFIAFSFDGKHSFEDFGIYRVSNGDRYNEELLPTAKDLTAEVSSGDGSYYFNTFHKQKVFNIEFAFEEMTDKTLREMRQWLNGKKVADLWFAENPYKVYSAKVTGQPTIKVVPFDDESHGRVYKGEGSVQFTCYWPYAHTPDYVRIETFNIKTGQTWAIGDGNLTARYFYIEGVENANKIIQFRYNGDDGLGWRWSSLADKVAENSQIIDLGTVGRVANIKSTENISIKIYKVAGIDGSGTRTLIYNEYIGKRIGSYNSFQNHELWSEASGLTSSTGTCTGENPGDLPAPFIFKHNDGTTDITIDENTSKTFKVGDLEITVGGPESKSLTGVTWDSKTGMVSAKVAGDSDYTPIPYTGTSTGAIPVGGTTTLELDGGTLTYHYWYY